MAKRRKRSAEFEEDLDAAPTGEATRRKSRPSPGAIVRFALMTLGLVIAVFGVAWSLWQGEQFLRDDPRFRIAESERGRPDPSVRVEGVKKASMDAVLAVFRSQRGGSLYNFDPDECRAALQQVEWVKDATVRRVWPNRISVTIEERVPVAFIQVPYRPSGSMDNPISYRPMLVDAEGMVLKVKGEVPGDIPLLTGVRPSDPLEMRRDRLKLMGRLLDDLREVRSSIAEIDLSDPLEVGITYQMHEQYYTLILGEDRFRERLQRFVDGYSDWKDKLPPRAIVDLTHESRIVARPVETASK